MDSVPTPLWLSHHYPKDYDRCVRVGRAHVCARCIGTYPVAFLVIALELALKAPRAWELDPLVTLALPLPALIDWARGRFNPRSGSNATRLVTGVLLGLALGRSLFLHMVKPMHPLAMTQLLGLAAAAVLVEVVSAPFRRRRTDPGEASFVLKGDREGQGGQLPPGP